MIGSIAGDIIGSPYRHDNLATPADFVGWNLFDDSRIVLFKDKKGNSVGYDKVRHMTRKEASQLSMSEKSHKAFMSNDVSDMLCVAGYLLNKDEGAVRPDTLADAVAIAVACGEYARTVDEAIYLAQLLISSNQLPSHALKGGMACAQAIWLASHGTKIEEVRNILNAGGVVDFYTREETCMLLRGMLKKGDNGKMVLGDGNVCTNPMVALSAAISCVQISESYEEAVRRAVALGGDSCQVGRLAGAFAEYAFGVPSKIRYEAEAYMSAEQKEFVDVFESRSQSSAERKSDKQALDNTLYVIRQGQKTSIYVIPEDRKDMEDAARKVCKSLGLDFLSIRPDELHDTMDRLSRQHDENGKELSGTYIQHERPELFRLWLQGGQIRSSSTRDAQQDEIKLPSLVTRAEERNSFEDLKSYADEIRKELQISAGYDGDGKVHFAEAFYPEVYSRSIDLMQGDILRGRVRLDDKGEISVDTNVSTGRSTGEYLQGVLDSMDIFHRNDGVAEIKQKLNEFCLDYGKIEDEDERNALQSDDQEAESVKLKYVSNIDRAVQDMANEAELKQAVAPELTRKEQKRIEKKEMQRQESVERYEGKTRQEAVDSQRFQGSVFTIGHSNYEQQDFNRILKRYGIDVIVDIRSFPKSQNYPHFNADTLKEALSEIGIDYMYSGKEMGGHVYRGKDDCMKLYCLESKAGQKTYKFFKDDESCKSWCRNENKSLSGLNRIDTAMYLYDDEVKVLLSSKDCPVGLKAETEVYMGKNLSYAEIISKEGFKEQMKELRELVKDNHRVAVMCTEGDPEVCHRFAMVGYALAHPIDGRIKPLDVQHITRKGIIISQDSLEKKVVKALGFSSDPRGLEKAMHEKCISLLTKKRNDYKINLSKKTDNKKAGMKR